MSNMVRKGDFLVFIDHDSGRVTEFFVSTSSFDLNEIPHNIRYYVDGCFGFQLSNGYYYRPHRSYYVDRKATLEERNQYIQWMKDEGHSFNMNTLELNLNTQEL